MTDARSTAREEHLRRHMEVRYGVQVTNLQRLDRGVFAATLGDGRHWVARVFPPDRSVEQVESDAKILQLLETHQFPAERCAHASPVTVLQGRGILITNYVDGTVAEPDERTVHTVGELLGRLAQFPSEAAAVGSRAGALHHYSQGGGPESELVSAAAWLTEVQDLVPASGRRLYDYLARRIGEADRCDDLPEGLIHPDPVLKNVLVDGDGDVVLIDWSGAGWGPRMASLAALIWSGSLTRAGWSAPTIDAIVSGYRAYTRPEERELERLPALLRNRPLVFACWRYRRALTAGRIPDGTEWWFPGDELDTLSQAIAARARHAFQR